MELTSPSSNDMDEEKPVDLGSPIDPHHNMSSARPTDIDAVCDTIVPRDTWTTQSDQAWDIPHHFNTSDEHLNTYGNEGFEFDGQTTAFPDGWFHQQTGDTDYSSIDVSGYPGGLTAGIPPFFNGIDVSPTNTFISRSDPYEHTTAASSPHKYYHMPNGTFSTHLQQWTVDSAFYANVTSSSMSIPMICPSTTATYDSHQAGTFPLGSSIELEPTESVASSTLLPESNAQSLVLQAKNSKVNRFTTASYQHSWRNSNNEPSRKETKPILEIHKHDFELQHNLSTEDMKIVRKQVGGPKQATDPSKKKFKTSTAIVKKPKPAPVSRQTSCWRCRRYKKPCTGKGAVCNACVTSGFRIWSSDIGCHRGDMAEFILMLLPTSLERNPIKIDIAYPKLPSFRKTSKIYSSDTIIPISAVKGDVWDKFLYKIQCLGVHGPGTLELLQIAIRHQRKLKKPDKVIVSAIKAMSMTADIFGLLIATASSDNLTPAIDLTEIFSEARTALTLAAGCFLRNCLTGRLKQWFTTFVASNINVFAYVLIGDAINALPEKCKATIWPNPSKTLLALRKSLYPTARDLLNALSKGSQPLNMSCWEMVQNDDGTLVRNAEGMRLVDDCEATFDSMRELQLWKEKFSHLLHGDVWMLSQPFAGDLLLISSVSRLFITSKG